MDTAKLQQLATAALEDIKAKDIEILDTTGMTSLFDRVIIATGDSNRHAKALARNVHDALREAGAHIVGVEGEENGEWILIDLDLVVVHVMQPAIRSYYNLEELWRKLPAHRKATHA